MQGQRQYAGAQRDTGRDTPVDVPALEQIPAAQQQQETTGFADAAAGIADDEVPEAGAVLLELHQGQRRGSGHAVIIGVQQWQRQVAVVNGHEGGPRVPRRPGGHWRREGGEQKGAAYQRRVEEVLAQSAEYPFTQPDRHYAAQEGHPDRQAWRQAEAQQQAGQQCARIL